MPQDGSMKRDREAPQAAACLITGGSGTLGGAIALALASRGRIVGIQYRARRDAAERIVEEARARGATAFALQADLGTRTSALRLVDEFAERAGAPPAELVAAQGIVHDEPMLRTPEASWDKIIDVNLTGAAWLLQAVCSRWAEASCGGHALFLGSHAAEAGRAGAAAYAASKAALVGLVRSVARELGATGVRANVIVPPFVEDGMGASASTAFVADAVRASLTGSTGSAEDFARFVADMMDCPGISGQVLVADTRIA
jgi:3-oxoacyl-[acyl-carrier protein] reductase